MSYPGIPKRTFAGLLVLGIGVMLLMDTADLLGEETSVFGTYWPVLLIAAGLWRLGARGFEFRLTPLIVLALGIVFLLVELDVVSWSFGQLWPVIVIVLGARLLFRGLTGRRRRWRKRMGGWNASNVISGEQRTGAGGSGDGGVRAIFLGAKERVTSQEFEHLQATAVFGGVEVDLTGARLAADNATLEVTVLFGGLDIRVPRGWTVNLETAPVAGKAQIKRRQPPPGEAAGTLTITGTLIFGGITVTD
jgi:predicted membrane protein